MILDKPFPPDPRVENEAISLIAQGHEVYLFCLTYDTPMDETLNGIHVRRYKCSNLAYKLSALAYTVPFYRWAMAPKTRHFLKENNIECIHIHDMQIADTVFRINTSLKLPTVLDLHENRPEIMKFYKHVNSRYGKLLIDLNKWEQAEKKLIGQTDKLIVVTEEAKQEALQYKNIEPENIVVVPNTIHPEIYLKYAVDRAIISRFEDTFNILYLGDTGLRRGTDTAIMAVSKLIEKIPNVKLILVGESSADGYLRSLADDLKVAKYVAFEGWQDVSLFPSYVSAAQVCISPLKRNKHHDTTFANKLFQYMAMGKPVVVSDSIAQANVVLNENCGLVHKAEDVEDLAAKLLHIFLNKKEADRMGIAGEQAVHQRWNWNVTSLDLIGMYESGF